MTGRTHPACQTEKFSVRFAGPSRQRTRFLRSNTKRFLRLISMLVDALQLLRVVIFRNGFGNGTRNSESFPLRIGQFPGLRAAALGVECKSGTRRD